MTRPKRLHSSGVTYKSKFEIKVAELLGDKVSYEVDKIRFVQPAKERYYLPDFKITKDVYIESKGLFTAEDRMKHLWIKEQHPEVTIYLLFYNSNQKLSKRSKTTYSDWADKHNIPWSDLKRGIPEEWFQHANQEGKKRKPRSTRSRTSVREQEGTV